VTLNFGSDAIHAVPSQPSPTFPPPLDSACRSCSKSATSRPGNTFVYFECRLDRLTSLKPFTSTTGPRQTCPPRRIRLPCSAPWSFPPVLISKGAYFRFCADCGIPLTVIPVRLTLSPSRRQFARGDPQQHLHAAGSGVPMTSLCKPRHSCFLKPLCPLSSCNIFVAPGYSSSSKMLL
jgi:hypothetical protein